MERKNGREREKKKEKRVMTSVGILEMSHVAILIGITFPYICESDS